MVVGEPDRWTIKPEISHADERSHGWWIVAKLAPGRSASNDGAGPSIPKPLSFTYDAPAVYPMTISRLSAAPYTDIALFVIADRRMTVLGPHGAPMAETTRFIDRQGIRADIPPFLVTELAQPIETWLDHTPGGPAGSPPIVGYRTPEAGGDRWRTFATLAPLVNAVELPLPGAGSPEATAADRNPARSSWITRLRLQLRPEEMNWDLSVVPTADRSAVERQVW